MPQPIVPGSSPLTRGKQLPGALSGPSFGLIPAHAGKTLGQIAQCDSARAHPRSRRENDSRPRHTVIQVGSSPLTRGKRPRSHGAAARTWAHPRSCGENNKARAKGTIWMGSSPFTRGKLLAPQVESHLRGLIPAHARKTRISSTLAARLAAHPRSCGENYRLTIDRGAYTGSSPLTRGKPRL